MNLQERTRVREILGTYWDNPAAKAKEIGKHVHNRALTRRYVHQVEDDPYDEGKFSELFHGLMHHIIEEEVLSGTK